MGDDARRARTIDANACLRVAQNTIDRWRAQGMTPEAIFATLHFALTLIKSSR